jgi:hypothetical protein
VTRQDFRRQVSSRQVGQDRVQAASQIAYACARAAPQLRSVEARSSVGREDLDFLVIDHWRRYNTGNIAGQFLSLDQPLEAAMENPVGMPHRPCRQWFAILGPGPEQRHFVLMCPSRQFAATQSFGSYRGQSRHPPPVGINSSPRAWCRRRGSGDSHLGHIFTPGPPDRGGLRHCINSAALRFIHRDDMEAKAASAGVKLVWALASPDGRGVVSATRPLADVGTEPRSAPSIR